MDQEREDYADGELPPASPLALQVFGWLLVFWALIAVMLLVFIIATAVTRLLEAAG
jgi:hypothetical protein